LLRLRRSVGLFRATGNRRSSRKHVHQWACWGRCRPKRCDLKSSALRGAQVRPVPGIPPNRAKLRCCARTWTTRRLDGRVVAVGDRRPRRRRVLFAAALAAALAIAAPRSQARAATTGLTPRGAITIDGAAAFPIGLSDPPPQGSVDPNGHDGLGVVVAAG